MKRKCAWVLVAASSNPKRDAVYCAKEVRYHIKPDDDENAHRVYDTFCPEHMILAAKQEESDEE